MEEFEIGINLLQKNFSELEKVSLNNLSQTEERMKNSQ
jgi:hypothetical protein